MVSLVWGSDEIELGIHWEDQGFMRGLDWANSRDSLVILIHGMGYWSPRQSHLVIFTIGSTCYMGIWIWYHINLVMFSITERQLCNICDQLGSWIKSCVMMNQVCVMMNQVCVVMMMMLMMITLPLAQGLFFRRCYSPPWRSFSRLVVRDQCHKCLLCQVGTALTPGWGEVFETCTDSGIWTCDLLTASQKPKPLQHCNSMLSIYIRMSYFCIYAYLG
jgi:hypothetical protein